MREKQRIKEKNIKYEKLKERDNQDGQNKH